MKYTLLFILSLLLSPTLFAQSAAYQKPRSSQPQKQIITSKADTTFHFDGYYFWINQVDYPDFEMFFEDEDNLTPVQSTVFPNSEWQFYYWELSAGDTLNWVEATAWFDPAGQANDWIIFGPLSIPASGADFSWRAYHNPEYRNGYQVLINAEGNTVADFSNEPLYVVDDLYDENSQGIDTSTRFLDTPKSFEIPTEYNNTSVYIAFNHNANDMDVLHLTDFVITSKTTSTNSHFSDNYNLNAYPNPANDYTILQGTFPSDEELLISVSNLTGVQIMQETVALNDKELSYRLNTSDFPSGIYFYSISDGQSIITKKLIIR